MILDFSKLALPALTGLISYLARSFTFLALLCTPAHSIGGIFDISGFFLSSNYFHYLCSRLYYTKKVADTKTREEKRVDL